MLFLHSFFTFVQKEGLPNPFKAEVLLFVGLFIHSPFCVLVIF